MIDQFIKDVILTVLQYVVPSTLALVAAIMANSAKNASVEAKDSSTEINARLRAIQERLDERDYVSHENYNQNLGIPIGNDAMWRDYYDLVRNKGYERKDAARKVLQKRSKIPSEKVANEVWSN